MTYTYYIIYYACSFSLPSTATGLQGACSDDASCVEANTRCADSADPDNSASVTKTCICQKGYAEESGICKPSINLGEVCSLHADKCVASHSICASSVCRCSIGYKKAGSTCVLDSLQPVGCFSSQSLTTTSTLTHLTPERCRQFCLDNNLRFAAVGSTFGCGCTDDLTIYGAGLSHDQCDSVCPGYDSLLCGGSNHDAVYGTTTISFACQKNCLGKVLASLPTKLALVSSPDSEYIISISNTISWSIFRKENSIYALQTLADFTSQSGNEIILDLKADSLDEGYEYRIEADVDGRTLRYDVIVDTPPYNGFCFTSGTTVTCQNWLDEGSEISQDVTHDAANPAPLTYTWEKKTRGKDANYIRIGETQGRGNQTEIKELYLESGVSSEGFLIDVRVTIADQYGATKTETLSLMVDDTAGTVDSCLLCGGPSLKISPTGATPTTAIKLAKARINFKAEVTFFCTAPPYVNFLWTIDKLNDINDNTGTTVISDLTTTNNIDLASESLPDGLYKIKMDLQQENCLQTTRTVGFFHKESPQLVAVVSGGSLQTVPIGAALVLDGSKSYDPQVIADEPQGLDFSWYCRPPLADYQRKPDGTLNPLITTALQQCVGGATGRLSYPLTGEAIEEVTTGISVGSDFYITLLVEKDSRYTELETKMMIIDANKPIVTFRCISNCNNKIIPSIPVKYKLDSSTTSAISVTWKLYRKDVIAPNELLNISEYTSNGSPVNAGFIDLKSGSLRPGETFILHAEVDGAVVEQELAVTQPPHSGACNILPISGVAFIDSFHITCAGWVDGDGGLLAYSWSKKSRGLDQHYQLLGEYQGTDPKSKALYFDSGSPLYGHWVDIHVSVTNQYGASSIVQMVVQIFSEHVNALISNGLLTQALAEADVMKMSRLVAEANHLLESSDGQAERQALILMQGSVIDRVLTDTSSLQSTDEVLEVASLTGSVSRQAAVFSNSHRDKLFAGVKGVTGRLKELQGRNGAIPLTRGQSEKLIKSIGGAVGGLLPSTQSTCPEGAFANADLDPLEKAKLEDQRLAQCDQDKQKSHSQLQMLLSSLQNIETVAMNTATPGDEYLHSSSNLDLVMSARDTNAMNTNATLISISGNSFVLPPNIENLQSVDMVKLMMMSTDSFPTYLNGSDYVVSLELKNGKSEEILIENLTEPIQLLIPNTVEPENQYVRYNISNRCTKLIPIPFYSQTYNSTTAFMEINLPKLYPGWEILYYYSRDLSYITEVVCSDQCNGSVTPTGSIDLGVNASKHMIPLKEYILITDAENDDGSTYFEKLYGVHKLCGEGVTENSTVEIDLDIWTAACLYWSNETGTYLDDGCMPGANTTRESTQCLCNHLTIFTANILVPPNTIDFTTVFDNLDQKLVENIHVVVTIAALLVIYLILVLVLRRMDHKDVEKWSTEALTDNTVYDTYRYLMTVHTGARTGAGTKSEVYFMLGGEKSETEIRHLHAPNKKLARGSVNSYILGVQKDLGGLLFIRIWHDNKGQGDNASWFLDRVVIHDLQTDNKYVFLCDRWFAVDKDDGQIERLIPSATKQDLENFQHVFFATTKQDMSDSNLWVSLLARPTRSRFTRVQRLSCCLALLFTTMIANAMWYRTEETTENPQNVHLGPFTFSPTQLYISVVSSLVSIPISVLIVAIFRKSAPKPKKKKKKPIENFGVRYLPESRIGDDVLSPRGVDTMVNSQVLTQATPAMSWKDFDRLITGIMQQDGLTPDSESPPKNNNKKKKSLRLPWWCVYVAWLLVFVAVVLSALFTLLYSFEWGRQKSSEWLTSFLLSFIQSILIVQPIKVILIAVALALIFRKSSQEEEDDAVLLDDEELLSGKNQQECQAVGTARYIVPGHRVKYTKPPVDDLLLARMKKKREKELKMWAILREILAYLCYLGVVCTLAYDNRDPMTFRAKDEIDNLFVKHGLEHVNRSADVWLWGEDTLLPNLYATNLYNGDDVHWRQKYFLSNLYYYRIGLPRIRLARGKTGICPLPGPEIMIRKECYPDYDLNSYDNNDYWEGWALNDTAPPETGPWVYRSTLSLDGTPLWGNMGVYSGGGYVADLGLTLEEAQATLTYLQNSSWLDRATRAVMVEFNLYNPNMNLFTVVTLLLEFPASGGVFPWGITQSVRLYNYIGAGALFRLIFEIIFGCFTVYFIIIEIGKIRKQKKQYLTQVWSYIELVNIGLSVATIVLYGIHNVASTLTIDKFQKDKAAFVNFRYMLMFDEVFSYVLGFLTFVAMVKFLHLLRFNRKIGELTSALSLATRPILNFLLFFAIIFSAFALFAFLVFGKLKLNYSTFISSMETLLAMMLMSFNFRELQEVNAIIGPVFFLVYILVLVLVVVNVLVSILNESFYRIRAQKELSSKDYKMVSFIMEQLSKVIGFESSGGKKASSKKSLRPNSSENSTVPSERKRPNVKRILSPRPSSVEPLRISYF